MSTDYRRQAHAAWIATCRAQLANAGGPEFHPAPIQPPPPATAHDFGDHDACGPDCTERLAPPPPSRPPEEPMF